MLHETGPKQTKLEREDRARNRPHRKQNGGALRPPLAEIKIHRLLRPQIHPLSDGHEQRHSDPQRGKDDVEGQRHGHL